MWLSCTLSNIHDISSLFPHQNKNRAAVIICQKCLRNKYQVGLNIIPQMHKNAWIMQKTPKVVQHWQYFSGCFCHYYSHTENIPHNSPICDEYQTLSAFFTSMKMTLPGRFKQYPTTYKPVLSCLPYTMDQGLSLFFLILGRGKVTQN